MNTFAVSSSDFQKKYKSVVERVKQTKQPALLTSKKEPQAVLISADALIALVDKDDPHSAHAFTIAKHLQETEATLL